MLRTVTAALLLSLVTLLATGPASAGPDLEHRGCCSHHGGVCGCKNDRAVCCDGQLSPTCGCD